MTKKMKTFLVCSSSLLAITAGVLTFMNETPINFAKATTTNYKIVLDHTCVQDVVQHKNLEECWYFRLVGETAVEKMTFASSNDSFLLSWSSNPQFGQNGHIFSISDLDDGAAYFSLYFTFSGPGTLVNYVLEGTANSVAFKDTYNVNGTGYVNIYKDGYTTCVLDKITFNYTC